jgi:hypothetical protein
MSQKGRINANVHKNINFVVRIVWGPGIKDRSNFLNVGIRLFQQISVFYPLDYIYTCLHEQIILVQFNERYFRPFLSVADRSQSRRMCTFA